jgi:hypothetical protein
MHIPDWQLMRLGQGAMPPASQQASGGPAWQWFALQTSAIYSPTIRTGAAAERISRSLSYLPAFLRKPFTRAVRKRLF